MTPRRRLLTCAVLGGAAGSFAMDVAQFAWASTLERNRPPDVADEETEAITAVVGQLTRLAPRLLGSANPAKVGQAVHYAFGIGFAAAYFAVLPRPRPSGMRAAIFGTSLWLLSDRILIPAFKLGRPWSRYSVAERSNALVSHLAYAAVVEFARPST